MQTKCRAYTAHNNLKHALEYVARGLAVFPVHYSIQGGCSCQNPECRSIGKHPICANGFREATVDPAKIEAWWRKHPQANIGLATGKVNNYVVVDVDPKNGGNESLIRLKELIPELANTLTHKTGGGGYHFIYHYPAGIEKIKSGPLLGYPGIDIKGDGGYIVVPPSLHASGNIYQVIDNGFSLPQPMPPKLLEYLVEKHNHKFQKAKTIPETIPEGERNNTLTSLAGSLHHRGVSFETIVSTLQSENELRCTPPLSEDEVIGIARSVSRYSVVKQQPHVPITIDEWPDPEPLSQNLSPVPNIDLNYMPELLRDWVKEVSTRIQCPLEYPVATAFALLSGTVGKRICIQPKEVDYGFMVVPNLWGGIIGNPGQKKTPAMEEILSPLRALNTLYSQLYSIQLAEYEEAIGENNRSVPASQFLLGNANSKVLQLYKSIKEEMFSASAIEKFKRSRAELRHTFEAKIEQETPDEIFNTSTPLQPEQRQFSTNDVTMEKLGVMLKVNPNGILVHRDELSGLFAQLNNPANKRERPFYLEGWGGTSSYTFERISRGHIHIPDLVISVFGGTQPDIIAHYISNSLEEIGNDGFFQRFQIMVYPDEVSDSKYIDCLPNEEVATRVTEAIFALATKSPEELGAQCRVDNYSMGLRKIPYLKFDEKGQEHYINWYSKINTRLEKMDGQGLLAQHLRKYHKLMPALALLCHLLDSVDKNTYGPVSLRAAIMAEYWCHVFEQHAVRIYGLRAQSSGIFQARMLLEKIREGQLPDPFTVRDVTQKEWAALSVRDVVEPACKVLEYHSYIRAIHSPTTSRGGRPTIRYSINPKIKSPDSIN